MYKNLAVSALGASASLMLCIAPVFAQTASSPVDQLETETAKLDGIYDAVIPVAVGAMAFAGGAALLKRVIYS